MASPTKIAQRVAELSHEDIAVRRKAALKLGDYGDPIALPFLCAALQDESWKVQRNAAGRQSLQRFGAARALSANTAASAAEKMKAAPQSAHSICSSRCCSMGAFGGPAPQAG